jgi:hypothetical protein
MPCLPGKSGFGYLIGQFLMPSHDASHGRGRRSADMGPCSSEVANQRFGGAATLETLSDARIARSSGLEVSRGGPQPLKR